MTNFVPYVEATLTNKVISPLELYAKLDAYYDVNGLYDGPALSADTLNKYLEALKPLRDVANRSVEFYANKIIPGEVEIVTTDKALLDAITKILKWSNFDGLRQRWMRGMSKHGDLFIKINVDDEKVFLEQVDCRYVVEFEENTRGVLKSIRIHVPQVDENGSEIYYVEYWEPDYFSTWLTPQPNVPLDQLGEAVDYNLTSALGIDFVSFVHVKFKDTGKDRGVGCFTHATDKIDEANRQATSLAQMIFKNAEGLWIQRSEGYDKDGRPIAPAPIVNRTGQDTKNLEITKGAFVRMPAGSDLVSTIPQIDYTAIREIANDMLIELSQDLPELKYYSLDGGSDLSGKAISLLLAGALDRALEAGRNFKAALIRAVQIALTMGISAGFLDAALGNYDAGDFDHDYIFGQYFQETGQDQATDLNTLVTAGVPLEVAMKIAGYSKDEIAETTAAKEAETPDVGDSAKNGQENLPVAPGSLAQEGQGSTEITQADVDKAIAKAKERGLSRAAALMSR